MGKKFFFILIIVFGVIVFILESGWFLGNKSFKEAGSKEVIKNTSEAQKDSIGVGSIMRNLQKGWMDLKKNVASEKSLKKANSFKTKVVSKISETTPAQQSQKVDYVQIEGKYYKKRRDNTYVINGKTYFVK